MIETYVLTPLLFLTVTLILLGALKFWLDKTTSYSDDTEIVEAGNTAIVLQRVGISLALVIAVTGSLDRTRYDLVEDLTTFALDGLVAFVLLILCSYANDWLILRNDLNASELQKGNMAVGIMEAGSYVAIGSILAGSFSGDGGGITSAIVFTGLGQLALVLLFWLYHFQSPVNLAEEVKKGHLASACMMSGELIALGIILRASISGTFVSWSSDLISFGITLVGAVVFLYLTRLVIDWIFLPRTTISQQLKTNNVAVGALVGGLSIGAALTVAAII